METKIWAHRGASGYAPENTLEAFSLAVEQGADGVELDIQLTKDGEIVVIHDEQIDRVSNGSGFVKDYTLAELKAYNFHKTHPEYKDARIPTLKEVYELLRPTNLFINVEIKTGIIFYDKIEEKVLKLTKEMEMESRVLYSSFNHYTLKQLKQLDPTVKTGILYADGWMDVPAYGEQMMADALHPALYNLQYPDFIKECRNRNLAIHVWTVNQEADIKRLKEAKVDAIITNFPDVALQTC